MTLSLKNDLFEKLGLKKGGKKTAQNNIRKAVKDFKKSNAPQFKGKSAAKRRQMGIAAGLSAARGESMEYKVGDKVIYEGQTVLIQSIGEIPGMILIKQPKHNPILVREQSLSIPKNLTEGFLGIAPISATWIESSNKLPKLESLSAADIGFDIINLREDDDSGKKDNQEEDFDNGSNVRHDGHTGKTEVDNLPTPSDTINPAYSEKKSPKQISKPLSTEPGYTVAEEPDFDGYEFPADAPTVPRGEFEDDGNARAPNYGGEKSNSEKEMSESKWIQKSGVNKPGHKGKLHRALGVPEGEKIPEKKKRAAAHSKNSHLRHMAQAALNMESIGNNFVFEMDDLLSGGEDEEPSSNATITVTMAAMAAILCTVCHKDCNHTILKSMVEALAEVGKGQTIEVDDLDAVSRHMNGEETQEIENREADRPDHEGIDDSENSEEDTNDDSYDSWPGDGEKSQSGKTKLMDDEDSDNDQMYNESAELKMLKRRAGLKFWD